MHRKILLVPFGLVLFIFSWFAQSSAGPSAAFSADQQYAYLPAIRTAAKDSVWQSYPSPTSNSLSGVSMVSDDDGWAVGSDTVLHWDGSTWSPDFTAGKIDLNAVSMWSATDGWAVSSDGFILHWDGSRWNYGATAPSYNRLFDVDVVNSDDAWAVGNRGTIMRWNGSSWTVVPSPIDAQFFGVTMVSANEGWIAGVGYDGQGGIILRWNGSQWSQEIVPKSPRLFSVAQTTPTTAWAVAENGWILHWENGIWSDWRNPTISSYMANNIIWLTDVAMPRPDLGWAVGGYVDASILVEWDGTKWITIDSPTDQWLHSIDMVSDREGWAVGNGGAIIHYAPEP